MPTIRTVHETEKIKVACLFEESGEMKPAWFQLAGKEPIRISEVSAIWYCTRNGAKVVNFEVELAARGSV